MGRSDALNGQVEPSNSPWASKSNFLARQGNEIRFCVDYRRLNSVVTRDSHGLGNMEDLLPRVQLSSRRVCHGHPQPGRSFHQVPLTAEARAKTAFFGPVLVHRRALWPARSTCAILAPHAWHHRRHANKHACLCLTMSREGIGGFERQIMLFGCLNLFLA